MKKTEDKQLRSQEGKQLRECGKLNNFQLCTLKSRPKCVAFTLSEVLITLGIIGTVAALTLPALIKNYQKHVAATKLKQTYSIIQQAFERAKVDYGDISGWDFYSGYVAPENSELYAQAANQCKQFLDKYFIQYVKIIGKPETLSLTKIGYKKGLYYYGNERYVNEYYPYYFIKLYNGSYIMGGSNFSGATRVITEPFIFVDINGIKGPNIIGKDLFRFSITYKGLTTDDYYKLPNCKWSCAHYIIRNNWKIPDSYSW